MRVVLKKNTLSNSYDTSFANCGRQSCGLFPVVYYKKDRLARLQNRGRKKAFPDRKN